jgi:hypothetical protein
MIDQLKKAIDRTVEQFQKHPLDFLSERDIQAWLFVELRNATSDLRYSYGVGDANRCFGFTEPFCIHPVTTEYFSYKANQDRFDIAVLSEEPDSKSAIWRQPCRIGIEIKLWQPGYGEPGYSNDVKKLHNYQEYLQNKFTEKRTFTGIAMLFVHPCVENLTRTAIPVERAGDAYPENGIAFRYSKRPLVEAAASCSINPGTSGLI